MSVKEHNIVLYPIRRILDHREPAPRMDSKGATVEFFKHYKVEWETRQKSWIRADDCDVCPDLLVEWGVICERNGGYKAPEGDPIGPVNYKNHLWDIEHTRKIL